MSRITLRCEGEDITCVVRPLEGGDTDLVFDSWLKMYRQSEWAAHLGNATYYDNHRRLIEDLLRRDAAAARVVALETAPNVVLSWIVGELAPATVHFAFTKGSWLRAGAARALVATLAIEGGWPQDGEIACTHRNSVLDRIMKQSPTWRRRLVFNPYRLLGRAA